MSPKIKVFKHYVAEVTYREDDATVEVRRDGNRLAFFETARSGATRAAEREMRRMYHRYCIGMRE